MTKMVASRRASGKGHPLGGITVAGYTKVAGEINGPNGTYSGGVKLSGGRDLVTGKNIGGVSTDVAVGKPGTGAQATTSSGIEVSVYVKPANVVTAVATEIKSRLTQAIKSLFASNQKE
jgi:hypothetical protein